MNWVDYLLIAILVLGAWSGLMRGLVRSVLGLVALGLGFVAAMRYYVPVAQFLNERFGLVTVLSDFYAERFAAPASTALPATPGGGEGWTFPDSINGLVSSFDLFLAGQGPAASLGFPDTLAAATVNTAAFLIILFATALAAGSVLSIVPRLPLLMPLDRAGGFCFGLFKGFVFGALAVGALKLLSLSSLFMGPNAISNGLEQSQVVPAYMGFLDYVWRLVMPTTAL